jgi:hypothetical protein
LRPRLAQMNRRRHEGRANALKQHRLGGCGCHPAMVRLFRRAASLRVSGDVDAR